METIKFYRVNEEYGFFSNFSSHQIFIKNSFWRTVEHFYQASKFDDVDLIEQIRIVESPMDAARIGRNKDNKPRANWDDIRVDVMRQAIFCKFTQHIILCNKLLLTGNATIIENSKTDDFWGTGSTGVGHNLLGVILMEIRQQLREKASEIDNIVFPPWLSFDGIEMNDMFWRMGMGEDYLLNWYRSIDQIGVSKYKNIFPEPHNWLGVYE
jgi:N-glycosidase YbiA